MIGIAISEPLFQQLLMLTRDDVERGAAVFLHYDSSGDRYLVHEIELALDGDCLDATATEITLAPQFLSKVTRRARESGRHLGLLHTHPSGFPEFSATDDKTEARLADFLEMRNPGLISFAFVVCDETIRARRIGTQELMPVCRVGATVGALHACGAIAVASDEQFDRQVRAFGEHGQAVLNQMTVAVVGLGGTGSLIAQQLAHLGVGAFRLIDSDTIESTNLNRVVGAFPPSVGLLKVEVARAMIRSVRPEAGIECFSGSVIDEESRRLLCGSDCIFICTDSHSSRAFVNELAYQYLVPAFDMGVSISVQDGRVTSVTGRVQMLAPSLPCLMCANAISPHAVREELMSEEARQADPYFRGDGVKQPAVISINSTAASLAVTMFLGAFTGVSAVARWQRYDALTGTVRPMSTKALDTCGVCGTGGVTGLADSRVLSFLPPGGQ